MAVSAPAVLDALADIAGREHVLREPAALAAHSVDAVQPAAVVRPASAEEVGRVLALCSAERLAVVVRGRGSSLALGNRPRRLDVVLELSRLAAVRDYVPEDMVATVEAGITLATLAAHLAPQRQMLALDPPNGDGRSVGGVLATNASGPLRFRYGTGRDLLLGARFVQADGTLTWGGARVVKSVTGYDVPKLLVGSLGTLGVIVEATLRLHPRPPTTRSWCLGFPAPDRAGAFLAALLDSPLQPDRAALVDAAGLRRARLTEDPLAFLLSIGSVAEAVEDQGRALERLASTYGGRSQGLAESAWTCLGQALDGPILLHLACEPRRLLERIAEAQAMAGRLGVEAAVVAQPGHGVGWISIAGAPSATRVVREVAKLRLALEPEGGSLVLERAPSDLKAELEVWGDMSLELLAIIKRLKTEFDPADLLAPGRFVGRL